jgi:hypothetical protein
MKNTFKLISNLFVSQVRNQNWVMSVLMTTYCFIDFTYSFFAVKPHIKEHSHKMYILIFKEQKISNSSTKLKILWFSLTKFIKNLKERNRKIANIILILNILAYSGYLCIPWIFPHNGFWMSMLYFVIYATLMSIISVHITSRYDDKHKTKPTEISEKTEDKTNLHKM